MLPQASEKIRAGPRNKHYLKCEPASTEIQSNNPTKVSSSRANSRPRRFLRRSARLKRLRRNEVIEIVDTSEDEDEDEDEEEYNEDDGSSSGSEKQDDSEYEAGEASSGSDVKVEDIPVVAYYGCVSDDASVSFPVFTQEVF